MSSGKPIPKGIRFQVLARDNFTCRYCGAQPPEVILHVDHVLARANGGGNEIENLVTACLPCNIGKGTMLAVVPSGVSPTRPGRRTSPPVEFFWATNHSDPSHPIADARCLLVPDSSPEDAPQDWWEAERYIFNKTPAGKLHGYSTHGASTAGFSPYEAAMYAAEILHNRWESFDSYLGFIDDMLILAEAGHLPGYIAPFTLRALSYEVAHGRCGPLADDQEYLIDRMAKQGAAVFSGFLKREHAPWRMA